MNASSFQWWSQRWITWVTLPLYCHSCRLRAVSVANDVHPDPAVWLRRARSPWPHEAAPNLASITSVWDELNSIDWRIGHTHNHQTPKEHTCFFFSEGTWLNIDISLIWTSLDITKLHHLSAHSATIRKCQLQICLPLAMILTGCQHSVVWKPQLPATASKQGKFFGGQFSC